MGLREILNWAAGKSDLQGFVLSSLLLRALRITRLQAQWTASTEWLGSVHAGISCRSPRFLQHCQAQLRESQKQRPVTVGAKKVRDTLWSPHLSPGGGFSYEGSGELEVEDTCPGSLCSARNPEWGKRGPSGSQCGSGENVPDPSTNQERTVGVVSRFDIVLSPLPQQGVYTTELTFPGGSLGSLLNPLQCP